MSVAVHLAPESTSTEVCIEVVAFRVRQGRLEVQIVPGDRSWSLPAGAPMPEEPLAGAARRLIAETFGEDRRPLQLGAWGLPQEGISVVFIHLVPPAASDVRADWQTAPGATWRDARTPRPVSGPHKKVARAMSRLQQEVELGMAGFMLVQDEFTVTELRRVHEAVCGLSLDPSNFRKRVARWVSEGTVEELPTRRATATRPARLYRLVD